MVVKSVSSAQQLCGTEVRHRWFKRKGIEIIQLWNSLKPKAETKDSTERRSLEIEFQSWFDAAGFGEEVCAKLTCLLRAHAGTSSNDLSKLVDGAWKGEWANYESDCDIGEDEAKQVWFKAKGPKVIEELLGKDDINMAASFFEPQVDLSILSGKTAASLSKKLAKVSQAQGKRIESMIEGEFQKKLKNPVTELEILDLFKMAASPHYIIPHIDIGTHKYNTGRQIKRRRTNSDCEESESEWE